MLPFTATTRAADDEVLTGREVLWSSSDDGVATVDAAGEVTAVSPGTATITATSEGVKGTGTVTVERKPVASVEVSPSSAELIVGESETFTATTRAADSEVLTDREVTWSSSGAPSLRVLRRLLTHSVAFRAAPTP